MRLRYKELSLQQIRSFRIVCEAGSYAETARRMRLSTSAVWEQIRGLERYLDETLLENRNGNIIPTSAGQELLSLVLPHLNGLESAREVLQQLRGRLPERLTVASGMRMLMEEIGDGMRAFRRKYPEILIRLLYGSAMEVEQLVEAGEADIGVILEPNIGSRGQPTLVHEPGYEMDYLLVTPPGHLLLKRKQLRLTDLVKSPLILGIPGQASRNRIDQVFDQYGLAGEMRVVVETNSAALTIANVRSGAGIGITAGHIASVISHDLGVRSLKSLFGTARYVFVWPSGAHIPPVQRELADAIRQNAQSGG